MKKDKDFKILDCVANEEQDSITLARKGDYFFIITINTMRFDSEEEAYCYYEHLKVEGGF